MWKPLLGVVLMYLWNNAFITGATAIVDYRVTHLIGENLLLFMKFYHPALAFVSYRSGPLAAGTKSEGGFYPRAGSPCTTAWKT